MNSRPANNKGRFQPLDRQEFDRVTVLRTFQQEQRDGKMVRMCDCICRCGTVFTTWAKNLKMGITRSCGCYRTELSTIRILAVHERRRARKP